MVALNFLYIVSSFGDNLNFEISGYTTNNFSYYIAAFKHLSANKTSASRVFSKCLSNSFNYYAF